jgi:hypothetical protein
MTNNIKNKTPQLEDLLCEFRGLTTSEMTLKQFDSCVMYHYFVGSPLKKHKKLNAIYQQRFVPDKFKLVKAIQSYEIANK